MSRFEHLGPIESKLADRFGYSDYPDEMENPKLVCPCGNQRAFISYARLKEIQLVDNQGDLFSGLDQVDIKTLKTFKCACCGKKIKMSKPLE